MPNKHPHHALGRFNPSREVASHSVISLVPSWLNAAADNQIVISIVLELAPSSYVEALIDALIVARSKNIMKITMIITVTSVIHHTNNSTFYG